jgi:peptidyl-tRNA hydrolase, PTH1 family
MGVGEKFSDFFQKPHFQALEAEKKFCDAAAASLSARRKTRLAGRRLPSGGRFAGSLTALMKYLLAGLGNIGPEYALTRHNIGFLVLDELARRHGGTFEVGRHAFTTEIAHKGRRFVLVKPTTYMNLSGKAVQHHLTTHRIPPENLLVITDDLALPYGKLRLKGQGSAGGHNGLKHIQETLQTPAYARLRFGIGSDFGRGQQVDFVLSPFSADEQIDLPTHIERATEIALAFGTLGLERTMNFYNK